MRDSAASGSAGGKLDSEEVNAFSGQSKAGDVIMVAPTLLDYVKGQVEKDVLIMKNMRKAREERLERSKKK